MATGHGKANGTSRQSAFLVAGKQHYWVHVAIDRFTRQVAREADRGC